MDKDSNHGGGKNDNSESLDEETYTVEIERGPDGLGIKLGTRKEDGKIVVLSFPRNKDGSVGPAESEGQIEVWDMIKSIGNMNVEGLDLREVSSLLKGKKVVTMTLARPSTTKPSSRRSSFKADIFSAYLQLNSSIQLILTCTKSTLIPRRLPSFNFIFSTVWTKDKVASGFLFT